VLVLVPVLAFVLAFQGKKNNEKKNDNEQSESVSIRLFPQILIIIY